MAVYTAQQQLARRDAQFKKDKLKSDYDAYLAQLATQYGLSTENLNANLEARGILRSGEAGTARTRLATEGQAANTAAKSNFDYNRGLVNIDLTKTLAAMQSGTQTTTPATTTPATPDLTNVNWTDVGNIGRKPVAATKDLGYGNTYGNTGLYGAVYPTTPPTPAKKVAIKPIGAKFR